MKRQNASSRSIGDIAQHKVIFETLQGDEKGFVKLSQILKNLAGINMPLNSKNLSLMASRLVSVLQDLNLRSYSELAQRIENGDQQAIKSFTFSLTTNTTQFFREAAHFTCLTKVLPSIVKNKLAAKSEDLRVWCAASSTGQEPYTILMTLLENLPSPCPLKLKMLATDIDLDILSRAAEGLYNAKEIQSLPDQARKKYFHAEDKEEGSYRIRPEYGNIIRFSQFNLMTNPYPFAFKFDVIFCRNVLIYFDPPTASGVIERLTSVLAPGGYLFIGHSESGTMKSPSLKQIAHAVYQKQVISKGVAA